MATRPSDWVNLQDMLALNSDQADAMGEQVYGDVAKKAASAQQQLTNDQTGFGNAVQSGTVQAPDPNQPNVSAAQAAAMGSKSYGGPTSLAGYDPALEGNVQAAAQDVTQATDPNQRGQSVRESFGSKASSSTGGNAMDSFLVGQSQRGQNSQLGTQYGGLLDNLGIAEDNAYGQGQAASGASADNAAKWAQLGADKGKTPTTAWHPGDYKDLASFMDQGSAGQYAHEAAMYASPADWATRGLGELGVYSGENASQLFAEKFGANGNSDLTWNIGNLRSAARLVQDQYGDAAVNKWFKSLTPETWKSYMDMGNAGAQARQMRAWLESKGFHKQ